jgi:acetyltransferase
MTESTVLPTPRIRPIQAADEQLLKSFLHELSPGTLYFRFGRMSMPMWTDQEWRALCSPDPMGYSHFIATQITQPGHYRIVGLARLVCSPEAEDAEFSMVLADHLQRQGLGTKLMNALVGQARRRGLTSIYGDVLPTNETMLSFCRGLGFVSHACPTDDRIHRMILNIKPSSPARGYISPIPTNKHQPLGQAG